ncbi:MAG: 4Fe-4S dicluster domain-containing protein [Bifidobacteriaceae bacterium]|nr:4Fe-4S dicluster domain-containing protein [Bifidobacteriaceae bacterium]
MTASIAERLARNSYSVDEQASHISVNQEQARRKGAGRLLEAVCPAHVYQVAPDGSVQVESAACLECGTCRVLAPPGVLTWNYPRGSFGIRYREG